MSTVKKGQQYGKANNWVDVKERQSTANGATWRLKNRKCYAEFGMTRSPTCALMNQSLSFSAERVARSFVRQSMEEVFSNNTFMNIASVWWKYNEPVDPRDPYNLFLSSQN